MATRHFTVEEANAALTDIEPLVGELMERRERVVQLRSRVADRLDDPHSDFGGRGASQLAEEFGAIQRLAAHIRAHGCLLKDVNHGLVDFPAIVDGREVYLCWRYGEPRVAFYHELHTGYHDRQPV